MLLRQLLACAAAVAVTTTLTGQVPASSTEPEPARVTTGKLVTVVHEDPAHDTHTSQSTAAQAAGTGSATVAAAGESRVPGLARHVAPSCTGTGSDGNRVQALYVRTSDQPSRYTTVLPTIRDELATIDDIFAVSSQQTNGGRRVRWVHGTDCLPVVPEVVLAPGSLPGDDEQVTFDALKAAGYTSGSRKYLAFVDSYGDCGAGNRFDDDSATGNLNDGGTAMYARVTRDCWTQETYSPAGHELTHMLGAVQPTAPNTTGRGHCTDEYDSMCYLDGSAKPMVTVCAVENEWLLDCGNDDYFHTNPAPGSYLATHWNTARSSFLDVVPVLPPPATVTVTASRTRAETGDQVTFTATSHPGYTYTWDAPDSGCTLDTRTGTQTRLRCDQWTTRTVTVTVRGATTDGQAFTATANTEFTKAAGPVGSLAAPPTVRGDGSPFTVHARFQGKAPFTYTWSVPAGCTITSGATTATPTVACTGDRIGAFQTDVEQADGQVGATPQVWVEISPTGPRTPTSAAAFKAHLEAGSYPADPAGGTMLRSVTSQTATTSWTVQAGRGCTLSNRTGTASHLTCAADLNGYAVITTDVRTSDGKRLLVSYGARLVPGAASDPNTLPPTTVTPAPKRTTTLAVTRARNDIVFLTGKLRDKATGKVLAGQPVTMQARWAGTRTWVRLKVLTTRTDGSVVAQHPLTRAGYFRLSYAGNGLYTAATSASYYLRVPTRFAVGVRHGRPNVLTGRLAHANNTPVKFTVVRLQRRSANSGRWVVVRQVRTNKFGSVRTTYAPGRRAYLRWVFPGSTLQNPATSRQVLVYR